MIHYTYFNSQYYGLQAINYICGTGPNPVNDNMDPNLLSLLNNIINTHICAPQQQVNNMNLAIDEIFNINIMVIITLICFAIFSVTLMAIVLCYSRNLIRSKTRTNNMLLFPLIIQMNYIYVLNNSSSNSSSARQGNFIYIIVVFLILTAVSSIFSWPITAPIIITISGIEISVMNVKMDIITNYESTLTSKPVLILYETLKEFIISSNACRIIMISLMAYSILIFSIGFIYTYVVYKRYDLDKFQNYDTDDNNIKCIKKNAKQSYESIIFV